MENKPAEDNDENSLESPDTGPGTGLGSSASPADDTNKKPEVKKKLGSDLIRGLIGRLNIYLLLFVFIVIIVVGFTLVSIQKNKKDAAPTTIPTTTLSQDALNKLNGTDASVGDPKQTLSVESNAIFAGKVLIRDSLDVAGTIKVGGPLSLPGLTVSGTATFDQIQGNKLTISGDANIQGQLTALKGITVTGGGSFGGPISAPQITVQSFQLNGDLQLNRHIDAGGTTPGKSDGNLGSGGTASLSGTDTAGTVTINFGGGPPSNACYVTVTFSQKFNTTPHVVISPTSSAAAQLNYYALRTNSGFQICANGSVASSSNAVFDYIVID